MDAAEEDVLAFMAFPREHRAKIRSTNPLERIKRRTMSLETLAPISDARSVSLPAAAN